MKPTPTDRVRLNQIRHIAIDARARGITMGAVEWREALEHIIELTR